MRGDGWVCCGRAKADQTHECNSTASGEKLSTKKHRTVEALESPVPPQGVREKSSRRCHLLAHPDLAEKCHWQHKPLSLMPGLKLVPTRAVTVSSHSHLVGGKWAEMVQEPQMNRP